MRHFALGGGGGISFLSYAIFEAGDLTEGDHLIAGLWTNRVDTFYPETTLVVSA